MSVTKKNECFWQRITCAENYRTVRKLTKWTEPDSENFCTMLLTWQMTFCWTEFSNILMHFWNNPVHPFKWRHVSPSSFGIETWRDYVNAICYQVWTIPTMFWPGFEPGPQQLHFNSNFDIREFYYKTNKNGIPFHDRERITNFQKYHEKITAIFQIEKWEERRTFQLDKGKYSN